MITLNGVKVPGYAQKVSAELTLSGEDMSGNSSYTPQAETGDKPKGIKVRTSIKFLDSADLRQLVALAEARKESGEREVYNIINHTAQAMNIRQVRFQDKLSVNENEDTKDWAISFNLVEYQSVPEKKEARLTEQKVTEQPATGTPITDNAITAQETEQTVELTAFEKVLKDVDGWLGKE